MLSTATKALKQQAVHEACTLEHYSSYVHWVYTAQTTDSRIIDTSGIYPEFIFLQVVPPRRYLKPLPMDFAEA